jgi:hypothetical protein
MAVENLTATSVGEKPVTEVVTTRAGINVFESTVEVTAAASATSTYTMARLPMKARITNLSRLAHDDLASTGSPTFDIGLFPVGTNFTANDDAINDGIDVATAAAADVAVVKDPANIGKYVYELAGESADPGGFADLKITLKDAACNTGGTVTLTLAYVMEF